MVVMVFLRVCNGLELIELNENYSIVVNFLYMLIGEELIDI